MINTSVLIGGFAAALIASLFSGFGGLLLYAHRNYSRTLINQLLNAAAGIMLSSAVFNLLTPAVLAARQSQLGTFSAANLIVGGLMGGVAIIWLLHSILPHEHESELIENKNAIDKHSALLFVFAIALHKFPEGLAIGVAYAGQQYFNPLSLAIGISAQNIPEGLMVAVSLTAIGYSRLKATGYAALTGLLQPLGAVAGLLLTGLGNFLVPLGMSLAGGTMLFVVINEVLPETGQHTDKGKGAIVFLTGFIVMTYLSLVME